MYLDEEWYLCIVFKVPVWADNIWNIYEDRIKKYKVNKQWLFEEVTNNQ